MLKTELILAFSGLGAVVKAIVAMASGVIVNPLTQFEVSVPSVTFIEFILVFKRERVVNAARPLIHFQMSLKIFQLNN